MVFIISYDLCQNLGSWEYILVQINWLGNRNIELLKSLRFFHSSKFIHIDLKVTIKVIESFKLFKLASFKTRCLTGKTNGN